MGRWSKRSRFCLESPAKEEFSSFKADDEYRRLVAYFVFSCRRGWVRLASTFRDHSYITSSHFWDFWTPLPPYVSMFLVLKIIKNWHFLTPLPPYKWLRNIWMVPWQLLRYKSIYPVCVGKILQILCNLSVLSIKVNYWKYCTKNKKKSLFFNTDLGSQVINRFFFFCSIMAFRAFGNVVQVLKYIWVIITEIIE